MIYIFVCSFCIFSLIDYIYIYTYLDSKIFYSKNGSKLGKYINEEKEKYPLLSQMKINPENISKIHSTINQGQFYFKVSILLGIFILMQISSILVFKNILFSKFVIFNLGYKKLELVSSFGNYFTGLKYAFYVSYTIFISIILNKIQSHKLLDKLFADKENKNGGVLPAEAISIAKDYKGEAVSIPINGLYQNILITGSIGSGKTSSAIAKITDELIGKGYSGLILDIKGNYVQTVERICRKYGREENLCILSDKNDLKYNALGADIEPIEMAARIKQVIEIISPANNSDSYWLDKVENVLFNMIILIRYYNDKRVNFMEIHKLVTNNEYLESKILESKKKIVQVNIDDKTAFEMANVFMFFEKEYMVMEKRIKNIISSEITRLTIPFVTNHETYKRFGESRVGNYEYGLEEGRIFVLSMNIGDNKVLSKILSVFIKLEFQKQVISNIGSPKTSFLIADEYQEFANIGDSHFLSLSREAKCINVLSMQSYTSLKNALKNESAMQVIIQNMVNKIWFRNDDNYTVGEIVKQVGKEYITKESITVSEGAQETRKNLITKGFRNKKSNISETINYVQNKENIYDENYFTKGLKTFEAVAFISDGMEIQKIQKVIFERWDIENDNENRERDYGEDKEHEDK